MRLPPLARFAPLAFLLPAAPGCQAPIFTDVATIDARNGTARLTVPAGAEDRRLLLLPFSAPLTASGKKAYSLEFSTRTQPAAAARVRPDPPSLERLDRRVRAEAERSLQSARFLEEALRRRAADPEHFLRFYARGRPFLSARAALADTLTIFSPFDGEAGTPITGTLRSSAASTAVYVDSRASASVTDADIQAILSAYETVSLPRIHAIFGRESDVDGNGVVLVFLAAQEKIGRDQLGFFRPADLLPDGTVAGVRSNEAEIMYVVRPGAGHPMDLIHATMAHETFHLVNFARKSLPVFQTTGGILSVVESLFLNEGLAHLTEDLVGWGIDTAKIAQAYLHCLPHTSLAGTGAKSGESPARACEITAPGDDSVARRGGMMLFLLYLFQQLGGATYSAETAGEISGSGLSFLRALLTSQKTGISNIEAASGRTFFSWYGDFTAALALDNDGSNADPRHSYRETERDPFTQLWRNVRMRESRPYYDGTTVTLAGPLPSSGLAVPSATDAAGSLYLSGADAISLELPAGEETVISLKGDPALSLGMTVATLP